MRIKQFFLVCVLCLTAAAYANADTGIGARLKSEEPVRVYLGDFTSASAQTGVTPADYKKIVEASLLARKSLKFNVVSDPAQSRIQISAVIKKYQYLEKGPLKAIPNTALMTIDAVQTATCNYAEMEVEFTVKDTKDNKILWNDTPSVYLKKVMTAGESVPLICDKVTKSFITKCFGKPK
jgi:hypothetical protein